jgi:hypothetical protein
VSNPAMACIQTLANRLVPSSYGDLPEVIQFVLSDMDGVACYLSNRRAFEGMHPSPNLTLTLGLSTLHDIASGNFDCRDPRELARILVDGKADHLIQLINRSVGNHSAWMCLYERAEETARRFPVSSVPKYSDPHTSVVLECMAKSQPAILTNMINAWKSADWNFDYLQSRFGQVIITCLNNHHLTMRDCVQGFRDGKHRSIGGLLFPAELKQEIGTLLPSLPKSRVTLFMGTQGGVTPLHRDAGDVLNAHIIGRKSWTLFSPDQSAYLYPQNGGYQISDVNLAKPDYASHPLFRYARSLDIVVESGEVLLLPSGWFHEVRSLAETLSVSFCIPSQIALV